MINWLLERWINELFEMEKAILNLRIIREFNKRQDVCFLYLTKQQLIAPFIREF